MIKENYRELREAIDNGAKVNIDNQNLLMMVLELMEDVNMAHLRIDRMARNYKILDSDKVALKTELKEVSQKLRKRIYDIERSNTSN